ncbi:hypothetical protein [Mycobacteroides abscessus]|uniref:hypothetical protein n=1 Tax=Mycobacteroides abscessus TaxID=36809 RepID=UPI0009A793AC|nr:hypothetical protein [Mycobacteroides abscessus]SLH39659.1 Uncharacterised protein [Mycobacteroides abscessus subsp. massiliense]
MTTTALTCQAETRLSFRQLVFLARLPGASGMATPELRCDLQDGHPLPHQAYVAPDERPATAIAGPTREWWLYWTDTTPGTLEFLPVCQTWRPGSEDLDPNSMELDDADCRLPQNHPCSHGFEFRPKPDDNNDWDGWMYPRAPTQLSQPLGDLMRGHGANPDEVAAAFTALLGTRIFKPKDLQPLRHDEQLLLQALLENWEQPDLDDAFGTDEPQEVSHLSHTATDIAATAVHQNLMAAAIQFCEEAIERTGTFLEHSPADRERAVDILTETKNLCTAAAAATCASEPEFTRWSNMLDELIRQLVVLTAYVLPMQTSLDRYPLQQRWADIEHVHNKIRALVSTTGSDRTRPPAHQANPRAAGMKSGIKPAT